MLVAAWAAAAHFPAGGPDGVLAKHRMSNSDNGLFLVPPGSQAMETGLEEGVLDAHCRRGGRNHDVDRHLMATSRHGPAQRQIETLDRSGDMS
jgi:hypothetical protein